MTEDALRIEYNAARKEVEAAESALSHARRRLRLANDAIRQKWEERIRKAEAKANARKR